MAIEISDELAASFGGEFLHDGAAYEAARLVHNGMIDKRPELIARCAGTADVRDAVDLGRRSGAEVSVRGGGHNVAGTAVTDGGLMIDLSAMKGVHVDPGARRVRAQAGLTWADYNRATAAFGLATTGGVISTTGIAGLTLGGGLGWMMGRYGLSIDNLVSAEVVLADGSIVTASADSEPELFWAIRGGGGNFGVVTSFEFEAHPVDSVLGGIVAHPLAGAPEVLAEYRSYTKGIGDDVTAFCGLVHAPDGSGVQLVAPILCHIGDPATAEAELAPIRTFGTPAMDVVDRMPYTVINTILDDGFPKGALNYWKSAFFTEMTDAALQVMIDAFENAPSIMSGMVIEHIHGAATRVDATATAFPHRSPGYNMLIAGEWLDPADTDVNVAWVRDTFAALEPYTAPASYVNYLGADDGDRVATAYGPNHERLRQVKGRYDPDNMFRLNQNIVPA